MAMQAKLQLLLTWDGDSNSPLPLANSSCKFFCDPAWTYCCDTQWVPRIKLSNAVFPYDHQPLDVSIYIPSFRNTHLVPLPGILGSDGSFVNTPQGEILQSAYRYYPAP